MDLICYSNGELIVVCPVDHENSVIEEYKEYQMDLTNEDEFQRAELGKSVQIEVRPHFVITGSK